MSPAGWTILWVVTTGTGLALVVMGYPWWGALTMFVAILVATKAEQVENRR